MGQGVAGSVALTSDEQFRDKIVAHLRDVLSDSISGITRAISEGRDQPIHRLTVAGYLAAMTDAGLLREVPKPPSKHYQLANPQSHWSLYERVGQAVRDVPMPTEQRGFTALAALVTILGRPVFRAELAATRSPIPDELPWMQADQDKREAIRRRILKRPHPRIDIPRGDPLVQMPEQKGPVEDVIRRALLLATECDHLAEERRATQTALFDLGVP